MAKCWGHFGRHWDSTFKTNSLSPSQHTSGSGQTPETPALFTFPSADSFWGRAAGWRECIQPFTHPLAQGWAATLLLKGGTLKKQQGFLLFFAHWNTWLLLYSSHYPRKILSECHKGMIIEIIGKTFKTKSLNEATHCQLPFNRRKQQQWTQNSGNSSKTGFPYRSSSC